ncbi:hypothetical protein [Streptomyces sp. NPDC127190]|uniref:hypothetical protein n=1 Tax=unclassified Streptomyces TaxID=2593676 RepID=UPI003644BB81
MSLALTAQDKDTLRTAAHGAIALLAAADAAGSPHRVATHGVLALMAATGQVGHVLAEKGKIKDLGGKSAAEIADHVLPALTTTMHVLKKQDPAEADNFRSTILVAVEAGTKAHKGEPGPALTAMTAKITAALDA